MFFEGWQFPISFYTLVQSIIIISYWMLIKYIVYITFGFKQSRSSECRSQNLSMVNRTRINSAQSIVFGISPVVKQNHPLPSFIMGKGVVSWFNGWYWFLSNVSQPTRIYYFTWKYDIRIWYISRISAIPYCQNTRVEGWLIMW